MALASAQVVTAVAALLATAVGMDADHVHPGRAWPLAESELPAWKVLANDEEVEPTGPTFPALQKHELIVNAEGYVRATEDLYDALHDLGAAALKALFASKTTASLAPLKCSMALTRIAREPVQEGEAAMGRITLALRVRFHTFNNDPETIT